MPYSSGGRPDDGVEADVGDLVAVVGPDVGAVVSVDQRGAWSWYLAGSRPSNMSGGSTTWSSTLTSIEVLGSHSLDLRPITLGHRGAPIGGHARPRGRRCGPGR